MLYNKLYPDILLTSLSHLAHPAVGLRRRLKESLMNDFILRHFLDVGTYTVLEGYSSSKVLSSGGGSPYLTF